MSDDAELRDRSRQFLKDFEFVNECPKCKRIFDPKLYKIVECPRCERRGSTYCCNLGGSMVICGDCELDEDEDEDGDGR